jgi:hypothetical protein
MVTATSPGWAAPAPSAATLFDEGLAALDRGELDEACAKLAESQRLEPRVGTLLNLADCEERRGRLVAAADDWLAARELANRSADPRAAEAKRRSEALERRIPKLAIRLGADVPSDANVTRARGTEAPVEMPIGARPVRLDPGAYRIVVSALGHQDRAYEVELGAGDDRALTVDVGPALGAATDGEGEGDAIGGWSTLDSAGAVVGGVGLVGVIVGAVFGSQAISKQDESAAHCDASNLCDQVGVDLRDEGIVAARVSTAAIIVGSALAIGGVVLMLVPSEAGDTPEREPSARAPGRSAQGPVVALRLAPLGLSTAVRW